MAPKYVMVRLRAATHARLRAELARLCLAMDLGHCPDQRDNIDNANPHALAVTLDAFISRLLDIRQRHRRRSQRSKSATRAMRRKAGNTSTEGV